MNDLFGHSDPVAPFRDIRDQRDSVAEEKARLCGKLNTVLHVIPTSVKNGSVQTVRAWQAHHKAALKVMQNKRSSVPELRTALTQMEAYQ